MRPRVCSEQCARFFVVRIFVVIHNEACTIGALFEGQAEASGEVSAETEEQKVGRVQENAARLPRRQEKGQAGLDEGFRRHGIQLRSIDDAQGGGRRRVGSQEATRTMRGEQEGTGRVGSSRFEEGGPEQ